MSLRPARISSKLLLSHFFAVLLVSGSIGTYFYVSAVDSLMSSLQSRLLNSAALISQALDAGPLDALTGPEDVALPVYAEYLALLREFERANPDIAYIYVMRRTADGPRFVLDSDPSAEQALPGTPYPYPLEALTEGFERPAVDGHLNEDRWGVFLSGYAPIRSGGGNYLIGIDMRADEVQRKFTRIRLAGALSLVAAVLLALLFSRVLAAQLTRPIRLLVEHCRGIAEGRLEQRVESRTRDEMDELIGAFNRMAERLEQTEHNHGEAERRLTEARDELERRVLERTRSLEAVNRRLLEEVAERERAQAVLADMAHTDPLTGLMNRRAMSDLLEAEAGRASRSGRAFAVLCADIDNFKQINDTHGHDTGDELLRAVAERLRVALRAQDRVARWGGEEFLLLLPDTGLDAAAAVADKVRRALEAEPVSCGSVSLPMTASIGVAVNDGGVSYKATILAADRALYRAKETGRNRVEVARDAA